MTPTPLTERMNELIAWAEERARKADERCAGAVGNDYANHCIGQSDAFREVANHLRQLSQGAKTDEG